MALHVNDVPGPELAFAPPRFDAPLDADALIAAVPPTALMKGFFVEQFEKLVLAERPELKGKLYEGMPRDGYHALRSYQRSEIMRVEMHFSKLMFPDASPREALRRASHRVYPAFLTSLLGRVVLNSLLRDDVESVLGVGPRMMAAVVNFGSVSAARVGDRHWRYHYKDYYSWLDSGDLGVIEGLLQHYKLTPVLEVAMPSLFEMWLDIRW